jgi:hypothetical protein
MLAPLAPRAYTACLPSLAAGSSRTRVASAAIGCVGRALASDGRSTFVSGSNNAGRCPVPDRPWARRRECSLRERTYMSMPTVEWTVAGPPAGSPDWFFVEQAIVIYTHLSIHHPQCSAPTTKQRLLLLISFKIT